MGDEPICLERLEAEYAHHLRALYCRVFGAHQPEGELMCAVAAGFTFYASCNAGLLVIIRISGRFSPRPALPCAEPDYAEPLTDALLPSRAGVRREAEALLRQYDLLR
ncbi:hypothetical protein RCIA153 [Methanocella arvoryzae MRE50]|uniref:Uncharacterized protein n=2 Tax=Methanocella TaxID=570266 RepID=Q0W352_METAR|nr:hypothetical protein RCIA153 [Methanocella arvoryzae MRE50]